MRCLPGRDLVLENRVRELLLACGHAELRPIYVFWNSRLRTTAGLAKYREHAIHLNPALKAVSEEEVDRTLRHELAHFLARHRHGRVASHGPEWRRACVDLGIPDEARCHQLELGRRRRLSRKFFYQCPHCGLILGRVRPLRRSSACLICCRRENGGRYSERFRLLPVPPPLPSANQPTPT